MNSRILAGAALWIGLSHAALAGERLWHWMYVSPAADAKSGWFTDQGTTKDDGAGQGFDVRIGGGAIEAEPDHLVAYELKGTLRGNAVTAKLIGLDTDEIPQLYTGRRSTQEGVEQISLAGPHGSTILLYRIMEQSH